VKELELRRHALREKEADALTPEGRVRAEDVGRTLPNDYAAVFVSPTGRAAETAAWFLRASGQLMPSHAVVPGLRSEREDQWRAAGKAAGSSRLDALMEQDPELVAEETKFLANAVAELFDRIPQGRRALAVGHNPLIEAAVYGLTGVIVDPLAECEGILLTQESADSYRIEELRLALG
jgi:broad specificity phosphatase PhoE